LVGDPIGFLVFGHLRQVEEVDRQRAINEVVKGAATLAEVEAAL